MPEPVEAVKNAPKAVAGGAKKFGKGLTNRPKWQYLLAVVVAGGVAYVLYKKRQLAAEDVAMGGEEGLMTDEEGQLMEPYSPWVTPGPSQGAYYGADNPYAGPSIPAGSEPGTSTINLTDLGDLLNLLGVTSQGTANPAVPAAPAPAGATTLMHPAALAQAMGIPQVGGGAEVRPAPSVVNAPTTPQPTVPASAPPPPDPCTGAYPFFNPARPGDCYKVVLGSQGKCARGQIERWHYYRSGYKAMVRCQ